MKSSNALVTIVIVGAVLVAAYAVGLLIRQMRVGDSSSPPATTEVDEVRLREATADLSHEPGAAPTKNAQEARAKLKEEHARTLEKMESATDEEKEQIRKQVRDRVAVRGGQKTVRRLAPKRKETAAGPAVPDPNASQSPEKTDSEPNRAGES